MTQTRMGPVLVTGAAGRVGRGVVDLLVDADVPVRALTHRSDAAASLPASVEVVTGDLTVPESLDAPLLGGSVPSSSSGPSPRRLLLQLSSVSQPTRSVSSFSQHRTRPRTRSSSKRIPWRSCSPKLSG
jgi:hypothetical protein